MWVQCFVASQLCCLLCLNGVCCDRNYFENYLLSVVNTTGSTYKEVWDSFGFHAVHEQAIQTRPLSCSQNISKLTDVYGLDPSSPVSESKLLEICPLLLYRAITDCEHPHELTKDDKHVEQVLTGPLVDTRFGYLYGTMAILLCSLLSLLGIPLVLCDRNSVGMQILLQFLIGLAVASMACDAVLHLWPMAVEVHAPHGTGRSHRAGVHEMGDTSHHGDTHHSQLDGHVWGEGEEGVEVEVGGHNHDKTYLWRSVAVIGALYLFFIFETLMHQSIDHRHTHSLASEEVDARRRDRKSHNHHHHHHHQHNSRNHSRHDYEQCSTSPLSAVDNNTPTCQSPPHSSSAANRKQAQHHLHNHDDHELPPPPPNNNSTNHQCCRKVPPSVTIKGNGGGSDVESSLLKNSTLSSSHSSVESTVDSSALASHDGLSRKCCPANHEEEHGVCKADLAPEPTEDFSSTLGIEGPSQSVGQCSSCFRDNGGGGGQGDDITCSVGAKNQHLGLGKTSNIILTSCKDRERKSSMCDIVLMQNDPVGDHAAVPPENMQGCKVVPKQVEVALHANSLCGGEVCQPHLKYLADTRCCHMQREAQAQEHHMVMMSASAASSSKLGENLVAATAVGGTSTHLEGKKRKVEFARDSEYRASLRHLQRMGVETKTRFGIPEDKFPLVMMIMFGDMFHNLSDGLAVGAAFGAGPASGISTSIAVLFHELPHELGDFAILYDSGISVGRILLLNAISSLAAFAGLFIGVALSETDGSYEWIFAVTAGMFLYVAFIDMLPQMMHVNTNSPWIVYGVQNLGLLTGFAIMLLLALNEE